MTQDNINQNRKYASQMNYVTFLPNFCRQNHKLNSAMKIILYAYTLKGKERESKVLPMSYGP